MKTQTAIRLYKIIGLLLCTVPAAVTTLLHFPLWLSREDSGFSVLSILVLSLCAIPARRMLRDFFRNPSAWKMWLVLWILFTVTDNLIDGLRAVACVACPASALGALFFWLAKRQEKKLSEGERHDGTER